MYNIYYIIYRRTGYEFTSTKNIFVHVFSSFNTIRRFWIAGLRGGGIKLFSRVRETCPSRVSARMENGQAPRQKTRRERGRDQDRRKMQEEDEERLAFREVSERKRKKKKGREKEKEGGG